MYIIGHLFFKPTILPITFTGDLNYTRNKSQIISRLVAGKVRTIVIFLRLTFLNHGNPDFLQMME